MIPRIIHVFWAGKTNACVDACIRRMADINPSWHVVHYTDFNEAEEIDGFDKLQVAAKSDWLRLCVVEKYGGVWLDASIICNRCIEETIDVSEERVVGFECPIGEGVLESWAFGAPPQHPLISAWKQEFGRAIRMGFEVYKKMSELDGHPIFDHMPYLTIHGAFVKISGQYLNDVTMYHSLDETHGPFFFTKNEWEANKFRSKAVLKLFRKDYNYPALLKLTGETRKYVLVFLKTVRVHPGSFIARTLGLRNSFTCAMLWLSVFIVVSVLLALPSVWMVKRTRRARQGTSR